MKFLWLIPCYAAGVANDLKYLQSAILSIKQQNDPDWTALIVDDNSSNEAVVRYINTIKKDDYRIKSIRLFETRGVANARNVGAKWAADRGYDVLLFLDADDIAAPNRLSDVRRIFTQNPDVGLVYSDFIVIDEDNKPWDKADIVPDLRQINNNHPRTEQKFEDIWIDIVQSLGYTNLTSTTSMLTKYIIENPFPTGAFVSEDYYAWLAASAAGCVYYFTPSHPTLYRQPKNSDKIMPRDAKFYEEKARVDELAVLKAIEIYQKRTGRSLDLEKLYKSFYEFQIDLFEKGGYSYIADEQRIKLEYQLRQL